MKHIGLHTKSLAGAAAILERLRFTVWTTVVQEVWSLRNRPFFCIDVGAIPVLKAGECYNDCHMTVVGNTWTDNSTIKYLNGKLSISDSWNIGLYTTAWEAQQRSWNSSLLRYGPVQKLCGHLVGHHRVVRWTGIYLYWRSGQRDNDWHITVARNTWTLKIRINSKSCFLRVNLGKSQYLSRGTQGHTQGGTATIL